MTRLTYALEYAGIKLMEAIVSFPPLETALRWGEHLGSVLKRLMAKRDALVLSNLSEAFHGKSQSEVRAIADAFWRNLGRMAVEFVRAPELVPEGLDESPVVENLEVVKAAFAENRGLIFVAGHYCNWEINGILLQRIIRTLGKKFTAIARPMRNPRTEQWVKSRRQTVGTSTILHREAVKASLRTLRRDESIGVLIDQNLYTGGVFVNFFGRPAATTPLPALLHSRTEAPVVLTHLRRVAGRFHIGFERIVFPSAPEDRKMVVWTQHLNDRLEAMIREKPEWWFWIHNRWKRAGEVAA